ncbi:MAG: DUF2510 domain-containing protein [Acidimicrobiales bacterium]
MAAPGFYADPFRRHQVRWWDGSQWTCHVGGQGGVGIDETDGLPPVPLLRQPTLVFDEIDPHTVGGALAVTTLDGVRVGTVRTRPGGVGYFAHDVVSELRDITGLLLAVHTSPQRTKRTRTLVHDPNGVPLGEFRRPGLGGGPTDVVLGPLLVGRYQAAAAEAVVMDVDGQPMAHLRREGKTAVRVAGFGTRPEERWVLHIQASVSWPMYLLLLTVPIDSSVWEDRRSQSAYRGAVNSGGFGPSF